MGLKSAGLSESRDSAEMSSPLGESDGLFSLGIGDCMVCDCRSLSDEGRFIDDTDARCVRYARVDSYWNVRSSLWKLDTLLAPIALTDREKRLGSVERLDSEGKFVSLWTRECRLFDGSCDDSNDSRRSPELLRSVRDIERYSPPG